MKINTLASVFMALAFATAAPAAAVLTDTSMTYSVTFADLGGFGVGNLDNPVSLLSGSVITGLYLRGIDTGSNASVDLSWQGQGGNSFTQISSGEFFTNSPSTIADFMSAVGGSAGNPLSFTLSGYTPDISLTSFEVRGSGFLPAGIPEPSRVVLGMLGLFSIILRRKRKMI